MFPGFGLHNQPISHDVGLILQALDRTCSAEHTCKSCGWSGCWPIKAGHYRNYHISEHGTPHLQ